MSSGRFAKNLECSHHWILLFPENDFIAPAEDLDRAAGEVKFLGQNESLIFPGLYDSSNRHLSPPFSKPSCAMLFQNAAVHDHCDSSVSRPLSCGFVNHAFLQP